MVETISATQTGIIEDAGAQGEQIEGWQSNLDFFADTASMEPNQLELSLRQRISYIEEVLQGQRSRLAELEKACERSEAVGDDAAYADGEIRWEKVEENIYMLESELNACNQVMQEKYYKERVSSALGVRK